MKAIQKFSKEYLEQCRKMRPEQIVSFLDDFRRLHSLGASDSMQLISIKVPRSLLRAFRQKAELNGLRYQTLIKELMKEWLGRVALK